MATPTQQIVPIKDVREDILILENGQMCGVLLASSMNFALKSSEEQQAILSQFQALLNTIDFSIQIYIQSRRLDVRPYLEILSGLEPQQDNDLMRLQLREYIKFIQEFTDDNDIMTKNFFIVVSYTPVAADIKGIANLLRTGENKQGEIDPMKFQEDRSQLEQRISVVEQGLMRIGIRTLLLGNDELTELFYHLYNPEDMSNPPLT